MQSNTFGELVGGLVMAGVLAWATFSEEEGERPKKRRRKKQKVAEEHSIHDEEKEVFESRLSEDDREEFRRNYDALKYMLAVPPFPEGRIHDINNIGARLSFLMMLRNHIDDGRNVFMLFPMADRLREAIAKASNHLPAAGQRMCEARVEALIGIITKGVMEPDYTKCMANQKGSQ